MVAQSWGLRFSSLPERERRLRPTRPADKQADTDLVAIKLALPKGGEELLAARVNRCQRFSWLQVRACRGLIHRLGAVA